MTKLSGRCFCGAVTWRSSGSILWAGHCHCESCRRATSAPFTSFFGVPRVSVSWSGQLVGHKTSQGKVVRKFCPTCGTQMAYQCEDWPDETHLYAATLDKPELFKPQAHFHYSERLPWVNFVDKLPKYHGSADAADPI